MSIIGIDRAKVGKLQDLNKMYNKKSYKFWTKVEKLQNLNNLFFCLAIWKSEQEMFYKSWTKVKFCANCKKFYENVKKVTRSVQNVQVAAGAGPQVQVYTVMQVQTQYIFAV